VTPPSPRTGASSRGRFIRLVMPVAGLVLLFGGCGPASGASAASAPTLTAFAAASLGNALGAIGTAYAAATGTAIVLSTESSTALRTQIEQGARADVFLSADTTNPAALVAAGLADGPAVPFAGNRLAIVVPAENPARVFAAADLARPGVKIIAAGALVPISSYAETLIERLAALPGSPADFVALYAANVVSREDNVRAVLAKVGLGEGDAGIVYASDASGSTTILTIAIPPEANVTATYAGVVPTTATDPSAGHAFLAWLAGPAGQSVLAAFGFTPAP